jgi:hypothetical protein
MSEDAENTKITKKKRRTAKGKFHRIYGFIHDGYIMVQLNDLGFVVLIV